MNKIATPITRLPIMAKQVLDLYELFKLVTARGGIVEVIQKKLWQEIIKGLNLPNSITSAAFTLRTQYMKYLYNYECNKFNLSTEAELQTAIDGNRREGRRTTYPASAYPDLMNQSTGPHLPPHLGHRPHMNGNGHMSHPVLHPALMATQPPGSTVGPLHAMSAPHVNQAVYNEYCRRMGVDVPGGSPPLPQNSPPGTVSPRDVVRNALEIHQYNALKLWLGNNNFPNVAQEPLDLGKKEENRRLAPGKRPSTSSHENNVAETPCAKSLRLANEREERERERERGSVNRAPSGGAQINSNGTEGPHQEGGITVTMQINGDAYEGVLFKKERQ